MKHPGRDDAATRLLRRSLPQQFRGNRMELYVGENRQYDANEGFAVNSTSAKTGGTVLSSLKGSSAIDENANSQIPPTLEGK